MASKVIQLLSDEGSNNLDITDSILCNLGIADIFALHATCRELRWLVSQMTESPYLLNINRQLGHYIKDPSRFRYELGKCDGIIGGEFVRNFLEFNRRRPRHFTIEIAIQEGPKSWQFIEYLRSLGEFTVKNIDNHGLSSLQSTYDPSCFIWVRKMAQPPIIELINGAFTTVDLNFMTWNKAYSLLPVAIVQKHKFYLLKPFDPYMGGQLKKLDRVGWTTRDLLWPDGTRDCIPLGEVHQIGGPKTLIIKLADPPPGKFTPDFVFESGTFSITQHGPNIRQEMTIEAESSSPCLALRYKYAMPFRGPESVSWLEFVCKRLNRWMFIEFAKMHPNSTPPGFNIALGPEGLIVPLGYTPPPEKSWTFADDQIRPWFAEWKREYEAKKRSRHVMPIYISI